mmetsp:Transcript_89080/g.237722  ORF Transcript_89080/g.237722 Transcript_89080/m.237722 type:complete len:435 (+) Transcript_89080:129-1433(+)
MSDLVTVECFDTKRIVVAKRIAVKSEVIRQMIDDLDCLDAVIPLSHCCCSHEIVDLFFECLKEPKEIPRLKAVISNESFMMSYLTAAIFLEIADILNVISRCTGPLHVVCAAGEIDYVKALLDANADVEALDANKRTPMDITTDISCRNEIEKALALRRGWTHLMVAACWADVEKLRFLIAQCGENLDQQNTDGRAAIHLAAERGNTEVISILVEAKANIHLQDRSLLSPIALAASSGQAEAIRALVAVQADVSCTARVMISVLFHANTLSRAILFCSAFMHQLNNFSQFGRLPLHRAAERGQAGAARALVDSGADVDATDDFGHTAIFSAGEEGRADVIRTLAELQADLHIGDYVSQNCSIMRVIRDRFLTRLDVAREILSPSMLLRALDELMRLERSSTWEWSLQWKTTWENLRYIMQPPAVVLQLFEFYLN